MTDVGLGRRIWITGPPGAGKTTLSHQLRDRLSLPLHELDHLFWQEGWRKTDKREFLAAVSHIAATDRWIVDGQYGSASPLLAEAADTLIWLDIPFPVSFQRVLRRTVHRLVHRETLWNGNRERLPKAVGFLVWAARTHGQSRRRNRELLQRLAQRGVRCRRIRTAADLDTLLEAQGGPTIAPHDAKQE
ncbi:AAA family ATPase [Streptomyces sp. NPDC054884]|uniref:AAA family ATPase n=1 Tax=unclassified Streptomyces TaxID=2593676 RepID=UPI0029B92036|nr:AAA family ATPase [Streptomyces sp. ME08-AFT2]MDX3311472.1 AAA family ATPase [Streptomyces sp. ME08-AFT2]